jgi:hypothetical protein
MNADLDDRLHRFIDGGLDNAEARDLLHAVADDPEARELLRFEQVLKRYFRPDAEASEVPEGFSDRVMETVKAREVAASNDARDGAMARVRGTARAAWRWVREALRTPRRWRPAFVGALAVLLATMAFLGGRLTADAPARNAPSKKNTAATTALTTKARPAAAEKKKRLVRFAYVSDEASSVAVAGDFTDWEPVALDAHTVDGKTVWSGLVPVAKGEHRYMFVLDGERWVNDPLAPVQRDDGFGHKNAVLTL